jgi:hypothetical protein
MVRGRGVRWWLAVVPVVGCAMVYVVEVRGKMRRIWSSILIEPHFRREINRKPVNSLKNNYVLITSDAHKRSFK